MNGERFALANGISRCVASCAFFGLQNITKTDIDHSLLVSLEFFLYVNRLFLVSWKKVPLMFLPENVQNVLYKFALSYKKINNIFMSFLFSGYKNRTLK